MVDKKLRDTIATYSEEALLFDDPSFDNSIMGIDTNGRVIYSFSDMIEELMEDDEISYDEAIEFIEYNTIRSLAYQSEGLAPIILDIDRGTLEVEKEG